MTLKKPTVFRICAVCGKRHAPTYGFHSTLRRIGMKGDKAAIECVKKACSAYDAKHPR